jgi:hypothetical protein
VLTLLASVVVLVLQLTGVLEGWAGLLLSLVYVGPVAYIVLLLLLSFSRAGGPAWPDRWRFFFVLPTMHLSWGVGFIVGVVRGARDTTDTSRTGI